MKKDLKEYASSRTRDLPLFVSIDPAKLHGAALAGDPAVMKDICGCRIPALLNARLPEGGSVLLAAADIGNEGADWGSLGLAIRRSLDGGKTWGDPRAIIRLQAHRAPQSFEDWKSPFTIDPLMMQAADGRILIVVDMWPESMGFARPAWLDDQLGYTTVEGKRRMVLFDGPSGVGTGHVPYSGNIYTVREQGWVYNSDGQRTRYYLPQHHEAQTAFMTMGDLYYAVGKADYLDVSPPLMPCPPDGLRDIYVGNIYISDGKRPFEEDHPIFVSKRRAGPGGAESGYDSPSDYMILETDPAPLRSAVSMFLWMTQSFDGGVNWTQPMDISMQIKREDDGAFLGVGPGVGLCLSHQSESGRNGRLILPLYRAAGEDLSAIAAYSDDSGATWRRADGGGHMMNRDEVQCVELHGGDILAFGRRGGDWQAGGGPTPVSQSRDGGTSWKESPETPLIGVRCQKSVITYPFDDGSKPNSVFAYPPGMTQGRQYLLASYPTGRAGYADCPRTDGVISLGEIQDDNTICWLCHRDVALSGQYEEVDEEKWRRFFAYSCMTVLSNGHVGIAYEPQPNNYIAFFEFSLEWLLLSKK